MKLDVGARDGDAWIDVAGAAEGEALGRAKAPIEGIPCMPPRFMEPPGFAHTSIGKLRSIATAKLRIRVRRRIGGSTIGTPRNLCKINLNLMRLPRRFRRNLC